jgi:cardiolipin synthase A/B
MNTSSYKIYSNTKEAWEAMYSEIERATRSIFWELYIFIDDEVGRPFFELLRKKAQEGVEVKVVVDSLGSFGLSKELVSSLRKDGVDIVFFQERKHRYRGFWRRLWTRTHRKVLVVDEKIGFVGGANIRKDMHDWYDIVVRFEGDAIAPLLRYFAKSYSIAGGEKKKVQRLKRLRVTSHSLSDVRAIFDSPNRLGVSKAKKEYVKALRQAKKHVIFFSPYYVPDQQFLRALWFARKRGVRVDILLPLRSDLRLLTHVAYAYFALMERLGVRVHLTEQMLHGKGVVVDDSWAMIGSSNIDETSFRDNYEANIKIKNRHVVRQIKKAVTKWLHGSVAFDRDTVKHRSWLHRLKVWIAVRLYRIWYR